MPIILLLYLLSFFDSIIGLATDIHLSPSAYNTALAIYFIAYVLFEAPPNVSQHSLKRFNPQIYIGKGLVTNQAGLLGIRFLLGVTEAGLFPGSIFLFSVRERVATFFGGATLAGAFGGILAYAIDKMDGLTAGERSRLLTRLKANSEASHDEHFRCFSFVLYTLSLFMPTIIVGLGFGSWQAQLMTVPPNALASISIWITTWLSSRYNLRAPFIIASAMVAIIGYITLLTAKTHNQCTCVHFAAAGVYTGNALLLSWPGENVSGQTKRAIAVATQITIGDLGAQTDFTSHNYRDLHFISIGYLPFAIVVTAYLWAWMFRKNRHEHYARIWAKRLTLVRRTD
ncbi:major facilitator superfamily domain-containing protein [Desarmillaria ectypa]|nr:major facilitator superfamily domain-containing protein [Desarmillaria ectypa]